MVAFPETSAAGHRKGRRLALILLPFSQSDARATTILLNELNAGSF